MLGCWGQTLLSCLALWGKVSPQLSALAMLTVRAIIFFALVIPQQNDLPHRSPNSCPTGITINENLMKLNGAFVNFPLQLSLSKDQGDTACHKSEGYSPFECDDWTLVSSGHRVRCRSGTSEAPVRPRVCSVCRGTASLHTQRKIIKETEAYSLKLNIKDPKRVSEDGHVGVFMRSHGTE